MQPHPPLTILSPPTVPCESLPNLGLVEVVADEHHLRPKPLHRCHLSESEDDGTGDEGGKTGTPYPPQATEVGVG